MQAIPLRVRFHLDCQHPLQKSCRPLDTATVNIPDLQPRPTLLAELFSKGVYLRFNYRVDKNRRGVCSNGRYPGVEFPVQNVSFNGVLAIFPVPIRSKVLQILMLFRSYHGDPVVHHLHERSRCLNAREVFYHNGIKVQDHGVAPIVTRF